MPGVFTSLGVSNVSFGLSPAARAVFNSVFLYHCVQAGLDMAIVNPRQITPYPDIPAAERELAEDLIFDRRADALARLIAALRGRRGQGGSDGRIRGPAARAAHPLANRPPQARAYRRRDRRAHGGAHG